MKCYKCRAVMPEGVKFCPQCGAEQGFDKDLIKRAADGEQEAITELYNRTYNNAYYTIKALISDEDTVLDILQDSYLKAFKSLNQLQEADKFRAWIKRIAHNHAVDYLRKTKPVMFSALSTDDESVVEFEDDRVENLPEEVMDRKETSRLIEEILNSLTDEQRLAISMFYYEQLSVREIAETLGVSENTVKSRLNYARKNAQEKIKKLEKEQGIRLHSLAPIPFLLWLFKSQDVQAAEIPRLEPLFAVQEECVKYSRKATATASKTSPENSKTSQEDSKTAPEAPKMGTEQPLGAGAEAASDAVKIGSKAAETAAKVAGKGMAAKVIAGVAAAAVLGGGGVAAYKAINNNNQSEKIVETVQEEQEEQEEQAEEEQEILVSSEEVFQSILDEYGMAMGKEYFDESITYPNVNALMLQYYYQYGGYDGTYFTGFYYTYYDIDENGTDELLIGYGSKFKSIVDVYGIKDNQAYKIINTNDYPLGDRAQLYLYPDGTMAVISSGGFESLYIDTFRLEDNGESVISESEAYGGEYDLDAILAEKFDDQQWVEDFDWKQMDKKWEETKISNAKKYIGMYINGQDWNAGTLTIEENDEDSVKVRLEAFRNKSDQELSTIFEGIGYETTDGLIVDISGGQISIKGRSELTLDAAASLKEQWNLDAHIYNEPYVYIGAVGTEVDESASVDLASYDGYSYYEDDHIKYRLDTADGNLSLTMWAMSGEPVYYERVFYADLSSADIRGNTYTVYNWTCGDGAPTDYIDTITFYFNDKVTMEVQSNSLKMAGGASDNILTGTYDFVK